MLRTFSTRTLRFLMLGVTAALALTGCGGDKDTDTLEEDLSAPASVAVELSAETAEIDGAPVRATVTILDGYGEQIYPDYALTVVPDTATINGKELTFHADAAYTVTATLEEDPDLLGSDDLFVDGNGPTFALTSPERATWLEAQTSLSVSGVVSDSVSGVASAELNGQVLALEADGSFSTTLDATTGLNVMRLTATDNAGNAADMAASVVNGAYLPDGELLDNGIEIRMNEGGLAVMASTVTSELDPQLIEDELVAANPLADESISCVNIQINATDLTFDDPQATLDPQVDQLVLTLVVDNLHFDMDEEVYFCSDTPTLYQGYIQDTRTTITATLGVEVVAPGDVEVTVLEEVDVAFTNFELNLGDLQGLLDSFGMSVSDLGLDPEVLVGQELATAVEEAVPPALEDALEQVTLEESFDLLTATATLGAQIAAITLDDDGLTMELETGVANSASHADIPSNPGSLLTPGGTPTYDPLTGVQFSLSLDTFNLLLHETWDAGGLHLEIANEDLGLDPALISLAFPGATTLDLFVYPQLPPIARQGSGDAEFTLDMGEMLIEAWGEVDGTYTQLTEASMVAEADVDASMAGEGLIISIGSVDPTIDVLEPTPDAVAAAESLEELLGTVAGGFLDGVFPEIVLATPSLPGFEMQATGVEVSGDASTWVTVSGELGEGE